MAPSVRDFAKKLLGITEGYLVAHQSAQAEYTAELTALLGRAPYRTDDRRGSHWEERLRLRQCVDELQAALDDGATDAIVAARLDALVDASSFSLNKRSVADIRAMLKKHLPGPEGETVP